MSKNTSVGRVLQIIDGQGWGGTKDQMFLLTKMLHKRQIPVEVALSKQFTELQDRLKQMEVPYHIYQDSEKKSKIKDGRRLAKIINEGNYAYAIANSPTVMNQMMYARLFIKKKPVVIAVKRSGRMSSLASKLFKYSYADKIVVVSEPVRAMMERENFFPERLLTIQSGIDLSLFRENASSRTNLRKSLGLGEDTKVFMNIANWNEKVKAQPQLMQAFSVLKGQNAVLVLAGYDTDTKGCELAKHLGIEEQYIGLGFRHDVHDLLDAADYYLLSSNLEGIAGSVLQAMAKGKVALSTLAGGIGEYLHDGINGFTVPVGDFASFSKKIGHLYHLKDDEYARIAGKARETAQQYSIEVTTEKYIRLFGELGKEKAAVS